MYYGYDRNKTDHERYLEDEVRRLEEEREREREEHEQARRERMREMRERSEANMRTAHTWPEALQKQAYLFQREAADWPEGDADFPIEPDDYFGPGAKACERALEIWQDVAAGKEEQIKHLEAAIQAIKDSIRIEVAGKLESESDVAGWQHVAVALREYDDDSVSAWLDW